MTRGQRKQMEDSSRGVFDLRLEPVFIKISSNTSAVWPSLNAQYLRWPKKYGQSRWLAYLEHLVRGNSRLRLGGMEQSPCPSLLVSLRWCRNLTLLSWPTFRCYRQIGKIGQFFLKSWGSTSFIAKLLVRVRLMGPVTLMSVLPAIRNSKVYPRKIPGLTMRNWKYPHLRHRPRTSGTRIMRLHPRSLLTMTSPWPRLVFFPQDFWLCQQISVFFSFPPFFVKDSVDTKRLITVDFAATVGNRWFGEPAEVEDDKVEHICDSKVHTSLPWEFVPQQRRVVVGLGEPTWEGMDFFFVVQVERCLFSCI